MIGTESAALTVVGFDSAWADRERVPGAICALRFSKTGEVDFRLPILVGFDRAARFIEDLHSASRKTIVAIDQPTIVPNAAGMRPCERAAAAVMGWSGGGIQPANRRSAMFCDGAPIWRFLQRLAFADDPEQARSAPCGGYVMEVFPALALLDFDGSFAGAKAGPRYNPSRHRTFRQEAWRAVCQAATREAAAMGFPQVAGWCQALDQDTKPHKRVQDQLDSVICLLVAALWLRDRARCAIVGDRSTGYIVAPVRSEVRTRLTDAARKLGVAID